MSIKLFVTTYALYNQGRQFQSEQTGFWFDVEEMDYSELQEHFEGVSGAGDELMFTDIDSDMDINVGELYSESLSSSDFDLIREVASWATETNKVVAFEAFPCIAGGNLREAIEWVKKEEYTIHSGEIKDVALESFLECNEEARQFEHYLCEDTILRNFELGQVTSLSVDGESYVVEAH